MTPSSSYYIYFYNNSHSSHFLPSVKWNFKFRCSSLRSCVKTSDLCSGLQGCSSPLVVKFADTQRDKEQRRLQQQLVHQIQQLNNASTWGNLAGLGTLTPQYLAVSHSGQKEFTTEGAFWLAEINDFKTRAKLQEHISFAKENPGGTGVSQKQYFSLYSDSPPEIKHHLLTVLTALKACLLKSDELSMPSLFN